jgi:hypothetical protein
VQASKYLIAGSRPQYSRHMRLLAVLFALFLIASPFLAIAHQGSENAAAASLPAWTRVFHLHEGTAYIPTESYDWLNSSGPANPSWTNYDGVTPEGITLRKAGQPHTWHAWILYPQVGSSVSVSGYMNVSIWARGVDNTSGIVMVARFYDIVASQLSTPQSGFEMGNATLPLAGPDYSLFSLHSFSIVGVNHVLPTGHFLALTIERQDNDNNRLFIDYDQTRHDSYISLNTSTFVNVASAEIKDSSGSPRGVFSDQENAIVDANVTNPFGAYDIAEVAVCVLNGSTVVVPATSMVLIQSDTSIPGYWNRYNLTLPILSAGTYTVNVTANDPQGTPSWQNLSLTILGADHFDVSAPPVIVAWSPFSMTVSARDSSDSIMTNWVGTVQLTPYESDMSTAGMGLLARTALTISVGDSGVVTILDQNYTYGEETIRIKVSSGSHVGWSDPIVVVSGPVVQVDLSPSGPETVISGTSVVFTAEGHDAFGNTNTTWSPNWTVPSLIGTTVGAGLSVTFTASSVGADNLSCANDLTGAKIAVQIYVVAGGLARIVISAPSDPFEIDEGGSQVLTATGYDINGNAVAIPSPYWYTNTSGSFSVIGSSAVYQAGYIPETGVINVRSGSIIGALDVEVVTGTYGPWWLNTIPVQTQSEDVGTWELSLTGYWNDDNGTDALRWSVEDVNSSLYIITHDSASNAILRFTTQPDQSGMDEFRIWVVDRDGYWTYQWVTVNIFPVNDPPEFVNNPPTKLYVRFDEPYSFDFTYYVWDVDNAKSELRMGTTLSSSSKGSINFDSLIATFLFPSDPARGSSYFEIITLNVADPADASSEMKLVVYVTSDYPPRLNTSLPDVTMYEREVLHYCFDLDDFFYDIDNSYLYYSFGFHHIQIFIAWNHSVYINATEEWSGTTEGTLTATDSFGALKTDTISVTVIAVNDPPVVRSPGSIIVKHNVTYYLYLSQYVFDPDNSMDSLTFAFNDTHVKHTSSFMGSHRLELLFPGSFPPDSDVYLGPYMVYIHMEVTDPGGLVSSCNFTVLVTDDAPPTVIATNPDMVYYSFPEDSYLNNSMRLYDLFRDSDDVSLNFTITGNTYVHARIYSNGIVNFTADVNWSGVEVLTVTARDSHLGWASFRAYVTVTAVNDAPWIYPIPNMIVKSGHIDAPFYILGYIIDSDDGLENLTITASPAANVAVVGGFLYVTLPHGVNVITVTIQASDGRLQSNVMSFKVGVERTMGEKIGWPYSFPLVLLAAGVAGYFLASRIPRPHALENLFLIHNDGRLVTHVTKEENTILDKDVVSAMFTAVQEFVKDSFQKGEVGLKKLEIGDKSVVIERGEFAYLALIYSGWPEKETFDMLTMLLRDIEERYKGKLEKWNGTMKNLKGVDKMLQEFMADTYKPGTWHEEEELEEAQWVDILEKEA